MVWALSVEHFPTLSLWSQHGTQSWIILGNFSILAKNHHWKKQMIGSYRIYFETCTAYWHCLRFSRQSALVCSDYSLDPKKNPWPRSTAKPWTFCVTWIEKNLLMGCRLVFAMQYHVLQDQHIQLLWNFFRLRNSFGVILLFGVGFAYF